MNEGKLSREKTFALRDKSKEEVKNINFRYADGRLLLYIYHELYVSNLCIYILGETSQAYANLGKSDPKIGEKRKAEDEEQ